jgi:hypothetical protein
MKKMPGRNWSKIKLLFKVGDVLPPGDVQAVRNSNGAYTFKRDFKAVVVKVGKSKSRVAISCGHKNYFVTYSNALLNLQLEELNGIDQMIRALK